jgi:NADH-quinone oxidoreductase subunit G
VQRLKPRENLEVNGWWMCDFGRHNYEWINRGNRLEAPLVDGKVASWQEALQDLLGRLQEAKGSAKGVTWAHSPNEEMGMLKGLLGHLGGDVVYRSPRAPDETPLPGFPLLIRRKELAPNGRGAEIFGFERVGDEEATGGLEEIARHGGVLIVVGDPLANVDEEFGSGAELFVYLGTHSPPAAKNAHFVLPITTFAEQEGTFTNVQGRIQRFWPGVRAPGSARPGWMILGALLAELTGLDLPTRADQAFALVAKGVQEFGGITYRAMGSRGALVNQPAGIPGD